MTKKQVNAQLNSASEVANDMKQSYTPQGRQRTCPWISLRGKEWKALSEIRDAQVSTADTLFEIKAVLSDMAQSQRDMVELEKQKLELKISS